MTPAPISIPLDKPILLFDGVCNLCNHSVQWTIRRDTKGLFLFTSLQSAAAAQLLERFDYDNNLDSVLLIQDEKLYAHSDVPLEVLWHLGGAWRIFYIFKIVPRPIRDFVYKWIAKNRYRWFGKKNACMIPTPDIQKRFI